MVAAEARASGIPIIVPDEGGASDQAAHGVGLRYRAAQTDSLAAVVTDFLNGDPQAQSRRAAAIAASVMTMDDHFAQLFAVYRELEGRRRHAA